MHQVKSSSKFEKIGNIIPMKLSFLLESLIVPYYLFIFATAATSGAFLGVSLNDWFMFVAIFNYPANNFQFHRYQPNTTTYNNTALGNVSPKTTVNSDIYLISEPAGSYGGYGELGEIRAYNTTFTTAEITAKYNAQKGKYGIT